MISIVLPSPLENSLIQTANVDNSASTTDSESNRFACSDTFDSVYLLSYQDYLNADYGFAADPGIFVTRQCKPTG